MEYKIDHDLPTKGELIQYSKDTLTLMRQNIWLVIKLIVSGLLFSSVIGAIVMSADVLGLYLSKTGASPDFVFFFYRGFSDVLGLVFTSVPLWLILFYTGFKLMEKGMFTIPVGYVIKTQLSFIKYFWTNGFFLFCMAVMLFICGLFVYGPPDMESSKESASSSLPYLISGTIYMLSGEGMQMGLGFYWFSFIHVMIFSALLFGKELIPNIPFTMRNLYHHIPLNKRMTLFFSFIMIDVIKLVGCNLIIALVPAPYNFGIATLVSGFYYLFISGVLYCYCVDKIEGRKLTVKVKESIFDRAAIPEGV